MVRSYSLKKFGGEHLLSPHFKLKEFASKDGCDTVLVSDELLTMLERLRSYLNGTITINSGYRSVSHNKKVGGAASSQHLFGTAADIVVRKKGEIVPAKLICCLCQTLGFKGIGYISKNAVHVDMRRLGRYRGDERRGYAGNVGGDFYRYFNVSEKQVRALAATLPAAAKSVNKEEEMTQQQFNAMAERYFAAKNDEPASGWSKEARAWAEKAGIINGMANTMAYKGCCSREMAVTLIYRLYRLLAKEQ